LSITQKNAYHSIKVGPSQNKLACHSLAMEWKHVISTHCNASV